MEGYYDELCLGVWYGLKKKEESNIYACIECYSNNNKYKRIKGRVSCRDRVVHMVLYSLRNGCVLGGGSLRV